MRRTLTMTAMALLGLAACATPDGSPSPSGPPTTPGATGSPPAATAGPTSTGPGLSNSVPPAMGSATAPPKSPTDPMPADIVVGTVVADASGPCYEIQTDGGTAYRLYGPGVGTLRKGDVIRATVTPMPAGVSCGAGRAGSIVTWNKVG